MRLYDDPLAEIQHVSGVAFRVKQAIEQALRPLTQLAPPPTPTQSIRCVDFLMGAFVGIHVGLLLAWVTWLVW